MIRVSVKRFLRWVAAATLWFLAMLTGETRLAAWFLSLYRRQVARAYWESLK